MKKIIWIATGLSMVIFSIQAVGQMDKSQRQVMIEARMAETNLFYLKGDLGITFGLDPAIINKTTTITGENSSTVTEAVKARLGSGIPFEVAAGYMFNKNFGVELGIDYNYGFTTKITNVLDGESTTTKISVAMVSVLPSFVAQIQTSSVIPYVRIGPEIGVVNNYYTLTTGINYSYKSSPSGEKSTRDYGGIALGVKAAVGVEFPLSKLISVFGEVQARAMSFTPKHGKVTKFAVNGQDQMSTLTTNQSKWDYVKSVTSPNQISADQPNQVVKVVHAVSNVGLVFGVKFNFGK
jgi:hypothetical protein